MLVAPITATALKAVPSEFAGIASGVNSTVSRLGSLITVAVIGFVITTVFGHADAVPLAKDTAGTPLGSDSIDAFRAGDDREPRARRGRRGARGAGLEPGG